MRGLTLKFSMALASAALVAGCAHGIRKVEIPATAAPAEEIAITEAAVNGGYEAQLDVLAPDEFAEARAWLKEAKSDLASGQKQSEILEDISYARAHMNRAIQVGEARRVNFQPLLDARRTALNAGAKEWPATRERIYRLDNRFRHISPRSEISTARFNQLQSAYLDLELSSIQARELEPAKARLTGARREGGESYAPKTLQTAEIDLTNAYNMIAANRHNPQSYQSAVERANASTQLLIDVVNAAKRPDGGNLSEDVATQIVMQNRKLAGLQGQLSQTELHRQQLSRQVSSQEQQLSMAQAAQRLEQVLSKARKEFRREEADVYREGDKLLIRLKAMHFPSGSADLPADALPLLSRVKGIAANLEPESVVVAGHTDSTGSAQTNQMLSQERAQAVAQYLETEGIESEKIQAVGQGYQQPIASNKTRVGRAQNRRVDVIITPKARH